jgi:hypothetical protein
MLISHFKEYVMRELKNKVLILVALAITAGSIYELNNASEDAQQQLQISSNDLSQHLKRLKKEIIDAQKAQKVWDSGVKDHFKDRSGIKIKDASLVLEQLKDTFKLKNVTINITNPENKADGQQFKFAKILYSNGTIIFDANTDIDTFKFVETFIKEITGFVQVKSLTVSRPRDSAEKLINDIESGFLEGIVKVKMDFIWLDIQDVQAVSNAPNTQPAVVGAPKANQPKPGPAIQSSTTQPLEAEQPLEAAQPLGQPISSEGGP